MQIRSYTVMSVKDIARMPLLERVQFTLNGRVFPSKRNTVRALEQLNNDHTEIYIHQDFLNTVPRYPLTSKESQASVIKEIVSIFEYAEKHPNIKGMVMHADSPFRQEMLKEMQTNPLTVETVKYYVEKYYTSSMFAPAKNNAAVMAAVMKNDISFVDTEDQSLIFCHKWYKFAFETFYLDLKEALGKKKITNPRFKIYIENTVKTTHRLKESDVVNPSGTMFAVPGTITNILAHIQNKQDLFGACWDLEHSYASNDLVLSDDFHELIEVKDLAKNLLIHLNTIESGVKRGSFKDLHSKTTISECSVHDYYYYIALAKQLDIMNIPYIREVKADTMEVELAIQQKVKREQ